MARTFRAIFDGEVLRPEQPTDLEPQKIYEITIEREVPRENGQTRNDYPLTQIAQLATDLTEVLTTTNIFAKRGFSRYSSIVPSPTRNSSS